MDTGNMCTVEKRGRVHLITLTGAGEHRLGPALISALRSAVASVRASPGAGALVLAAEGKYFSNGYDQAWARTVPYQLHVSMRGAFRGLVADLLALPIPTVAAVTGHAAAAGCALALAHDRRWRSLRKRRLVKHELLAYGHAYWELQLPSSGRPREVTCPTCELRTKGPAGHQVIPSTPVNKATVGTAESQPVRQAVQEKSNLDTLRGASVPEDEEEFLPVYVGNLSPATSVFDLEKVFQAFGRIKPNGVAIRSRKEAGVFFGFVEYENMSGIHNALNASPIELNGRQVFVEERRPTELAGVWGECFFFTIK